MVEEVKLRTKLEINFSEEYTKQLITAKEWQEEQFKEAKREYERKKAQIKYVPLVSQDYSSKPTSNYIQNNYSYPSYQNQISQAIILVQGVQNANQPIFILTQKDLV